MAIALFILAGGLVVLPHISTHTQVMVWAIAMGLGGGLVMVLFFSVWPRLFGRRHLGTIQGAAQALTVVASALGPLLLAWCVEWTGSYAMMFRALAGVIALVACAALVVPEPEHYFEQWVKGALELHDFFGRVPLPPSWCHGVH
jgi:MFS family permease